MWVFLEAAQERARRALKGNGPAERSPSNRNPGHFPQHLPRVGEDASERLDAVSAQLRVLVTRRPKHARRRCSAVVAQGEPSCAIGSSPMASASEHVVPGGLPTEALVAQVMVAKSGDHLPFYRQSEMYTRQWITLDRATL
ncbi:transposase (plasmid) [Ponticoccus alexandrii]|uniref:Transposase n=1 Tax=Ponticoccus alexandrii TaxID=1943633 RepID=A0ABX7FET4_9RHOB|nr:transposase [Ponticoccus alexandrii]